MPARSQPVKAGGLIRVSGCYSQSTRHPSASAVRSSDSLGGFSSLSNRQKALSEAVWRSADLGIRIVFVLFFFSCFVPGEITIFGSGRTVGCRVWTGMYILPGTYRNSEDAYGASTYVLQWPGKPPLGPARGRICPGCVSQGIFGDFADGCGCAGRQMAGWHECREKCSFQRHLAVVVGCRVR